MEEPDKLCEDCGYLMSWHCTEHGCCPTEETANLYEEHPNLRQMHFYL